MIPERQRLPDTRGSVTRKLSIRRPDDEGIDVYVTVGFYESGDPGEVFIKVGKQGSTISGLLDAVAVCISVGLQHGILLSIYVRKLRHWSFDPSGATGDPDQPMASSVLDLVAGWLERNVKGGKA